MLNLTGALYKMLTLPNRDLANVFLTNMMASSIGH